MKDPVLAPAQLRAALERAEGALRESQRQYREIFELARTRCANWISVATSTCVPKIAPP